MTVESVIYAAPFILLSLISAVTCLAIPQLRKYTLQAVVAPVAFGLCSIVGMAVMVLSGDVLTKRFQIVVSPGPLAGIEDILISLFIYLIFLASSELGLQCTSQQNDTAVSTIAVARRSTH